MCWWVLMVVLGFPWVLWVLCGFWGALRVLGCP